MTMKQSLPLAFVLFVALILAVVGLYAQTASAAACTPRTDWPTYRIARGDTLGSIARRYKTTTNVLAAANCIVNVNRVYAGQVLRVPRGSVPPPPPPNQGVIITGATYQRYENGFMIWRGDNGTILIFFGLGNGTFAGYDSVSYGLLPLNPVAEPPPTGRIKPIMGFGRVWGNIRGVRQGLGWAVEPERSFTLRLETAPGSTPYRPESYTLNVPDGRIVYLNRTNWNFGPLPPGQVPTPVPTYPPNTIQAAFQPFENGYMIWNSGSQSILVLFKQDSRYVYYSIDAYRNLPDNPVTDTPPAGRVKPINGFGRIWGHYVADVRAAVGWGLGPEQSYTATFAGYEFTPGYSITVPDGRKVILSSDKWSWGS